MAAAGPNDDIINNIANAIVEGTRVKRYDALVAQTPRGKDVAENGKIDGNILRIRKEAVVIRENPAKKGEMFDDILAYFYGITDGSEREKNIVEAADKAKKYIIEQIKPSSRYIAGIENSGNRVLKKVMDLLKQDWNKLKPSDRKPDDEKVDVPPPLEDVGDEKKDGKEMKVIIDAGFIENVARKYEEMQLAIANLGDDVRRNAAEMRNENSDLGAIAIIEKEAKDAETKTRLIQAYNAIAGSPDMLDKLDEVCRNMNITDKTQRDMLKKALMRKVLGGDVFAKRQRIRQLLLKEGVRDEQELDQIADKILDDELRVQIKGDKKLVKGREVGKKRSDDEIYLPASEPVVAVLKDNLALDEARPRFEYAKLDMMKEIASTAVEVEVKRQQKKYARAFMMEKIADSKLIEMEDGVPSTMLTPQQQNIMNDFDKDLSVRYDTGTIFKKQDYSIPLIGINPKHTTVDKRMLLFC